MKHFARHVDLVVNNGQFLETSARLLAERASPFASLQRFSCWLDQRTDGARSINLARLARCLGEYVRDELRMPPAEAEEMINRDYTRAGRKPIVLSDRSARQPAPWSGLPSRQARHQHGKPDEC